MIASISATSYSSDATKSYHISHRQVNGVDNKKHNLFALSFVVIFAALLTSFPARNADLLRHMAAGRGLVSGLESVLSTSTIGPNWLFDLMVYCAYSFAGGIGLGLIKVLLTAGTAVVLLRLANSGTHWLVSTSCVALALLAMATRLFLQPAIISYFLFALTLWIVYQKNKSQSGCIPPCLLLLLFVIWANSDARFVIGLGTIGLIWLGRVCDERHLAALPRYAVSLFVIALACLVNPSHIYAFALPSEFVVKAGDVNSPFQQEYITTLGSTPAGMAYYPLLGLAAISFVLNRQGWRWERFLPFMVLAILSMVQIRIAPFFAILAGPILAWNLHGWITQRASASKSAWTNMKSRLAIITGIALIVCAWPGWLQSPPYEPRRWGLEVPESLKQGAIVVCRWHDDSDQDKSRSLFLSSDAEAAFAWFCPQEKGIVDNDLAASIAQGTARQDDWVSRMRAARINQIIAYHPNRAFLFNVFAQLFADPNQWPLIYQNGDFAVFGWRDPAQKETTQFVQPQKPDFDQLAFGVGKVEKAPPTTDDFKERRWWDSFIKPATLRPSDRDAASVNLLHAEVQRQTAPIHHRIAWEAAQAASLVAVATTLHTSSILPMQLAIGFPVISDSPNRVTSFSDLTQFALQSQQLYALGRDDTAPSLLYLAIRAARRAIAADPTDAQSHVLLGKAYLLLLESTRERRWDEFVSEIGELRNAQAAAALNRAITLQPNLAEAHLLLGTLYLRTRIIDLALHHFNIYLRLSRKIDPMSAKAMEEEISQLAKTVSEREKTFAAEATGAPVLDRAAIAMRLGLGGKARDLLLASDIAAFGPQGMHLELELLLRTGQPEKVRDWLEPEHEGALGTAVYRWLRVQAYAATGNYAAAQDEITRSTDWPEPGSVRDALAVMIGQAVVGSWPGKNHLPDIISRTLGRYNYVVWLEEFVQKLQTQADVMAMRGLLALEEGDIETARQAFQASLEGPDEIGTGLHFYTRTIARECLAWLKSNERQQ
jgi:tetratricopeptide (TPR) repeat protein